MTISGVVSGSTINSDGQGSELVLEMKDCTFDLPNETRFLFARVGSETFSMAFDIDVTLVAPSLTGQMVTVVDSTVAKPVASKFNLAVAGLKDGVGYAAWSGSYAPTKYKLPRQMSTVTLVTTAASTNTMAAPEAYNHFYPIAPKVLYTPVDFPTTEAFAVGNFDTSYPTTTAFRARINRTTGAAFTVSGTAKFNAEAVLEKG